MKKLSIEEFGNLTASKEPVPGGGSVAAACGSLSGALAEMVANITIGKKKYIEVNDEMVDIAVKASELRKSLLEDIEKDSDAFNLVMKAFSMPKTTDKDKVLRSKAIQEGLKAASITPFEAAKKSLEVEKLAAVVVKKGNKNARTDGLVAVMLSRTAVLSACLNVKVNIDSIKDESFVKDMEEKISEVIKTALSIEAETLAAFNMLSV